MSSHSPRVASAAPQHPLMAHLESVQTLHRVAYQGRTVCWHQFGQGTPLVLLHGGHGNWMHWIRNIEVLSQQHTLWIPDMPGFGESDDLDVAPHAAQRMEVLVDALINTLGKLVEGDTPVDVAGFSFGGLVAAQFAARRGYIGRMALLGTAGHGGPRREAVPLVNWRFSDRAQMLAGLRHNLAAFMLHDPQSIDDLAMTVHEAACLMTRFRSKAISRSALIGEVLTAFEQPVLLIWGEHDVTATPAVIAPQLTHAHPGHEWRIVPGAGHWIQFERDQVVNQMLLDWFVRAPR